MRYRLRKFVEALSVQERNELKDLLNTPVYLTLEEHQHVRAGRKLQAVRCLRERTGLGLWEAVKFIEKEMAR